MEINQIESTVGAVVPVLLALFAIRPVSTRELFRFVDRYGVEVNKETLPTVTRSIRRNRTTKLAGAALGLSLHNILFGLGVNIPNDGLSYAVLAYLLGAFVTAFNSQYRAREVRKASLAPPRASRLSAEDRADRASWSRLSRAAWRSSHTSSSPGQRL